MIETYQTTNNNCTSACLSSIFEISINQFPELPDNDTWLSVLNKWLLKFELFAICIRFKDSKESDTLKGWSIGSIQSPRNSNLRHSVVCYDGYIIWDPIEGKKDGTQKPDDWVVFVTMNPEKNYGEIRNEKE